jgi:hypothetical protein
VGPTDIVEWPLTAFQRDYWQFHAEGSRTTGARVVFGVDLRGRLDRGALAAALVELRRIHPVLRTVYGARDSTVRQQIVEADDAQVPLTTIECAPLQVNAIAEPTRDLIRAHFDLGRGPCWQAILAADRGDASRHALLFDVHHIGWDGMSAPIALRDLGALYAALTDRAAPRPRPPAETMRYIDLARELDEHAATPAGIADRAYWRDLLLGAPATLLPEDRTHDRGRHVSVMRAARGTLPAPQTVAACASALVALLHDTTGQNDICIEFAAAQRHYHAALAGALGPFEHNLVLRADVGDDASARGILPAIETQLQTALEHARAPATDLALPGMRRVGLDVLKASASGFGQSIDFGPNVRAVGFTPVLDTTSLYDLFVQIRGPNVAVFASEELFDPATCERLLAGFLARLGAA